MSYPKITLPKFKFDWTTFSAMGQLVVHLPLQRLLCLPIIYSRPRRLTSIDLMTLVLCTLGPLCVRLMEEVDKRIKCTYFLILFSRTEILAGAILFPRAATPGKGSIL